MPRWTRRELITSTLAATAAIIPATRATASPVTTLPDWGDGDLQTGPLGINTATDPGQIPVAIRIPDAGVDAEIERQQIINGQMLDPTGPWVVSWYEPTARVGAIGNCVAAGHVDYWDIGAAVFHDLANIPTGGLIEITGKGGTIYTYAVTSIRQVDIETLTLEELRGPDLVGHTDYPALTLITCGGTFNGEEYLSRDIVRAELVASQPPENA